jgi:hypothetical protein
VGDYLSDALLMLSLIAPPTILGMLLFYGLSMSRHHPHGHGDQQPAMPSKGRNSTAPRAH